jgi:hypothetical protein
MRNGKNTKVPWTGIQRLIESGSIGYAEAAKKMGVSVEAVRQKAYRERWLSPERVKKAAGSLCAVMPEEVLQDAADSWREKGECHRVRVFELAHEALQRARLPTVKTWSDAQVADNMARKAIGLDDETAKTNAVINVQWMRETAGQFASAGSC